jgi:hypothetical protein
MPQEKIYAPVSIKEIETQYGPLLKLSFRADKLREFLDQHTNAKGYVNLNVSRRKELSQYGETHYATLDTWEPKGQQAERQASQRIASRPAPAPQPGGGDDDDSGIPF